MTVPTNRNREDYTGTGTVGPFPYTFPINRDEDLTVIVTDLDGTETTLTLTTDYTVTGAELLAGGSVTLVNALTSGYGLTILRVVDVTQETDLRNQGGYFPEVIEDAMDKLTMIDIQQQEELARCMKVSPGSTDSATLPTSQEGTVLGWVGGALRNLSSAAADLGVNLLSAAVGYGDALMTVLQPWTGAVATTQHEVNSRLVNGFDCMTSAQRADVGAFTYGEDVTAAVQAVLDKAGDYTWNDPDYDYYDNGGRVVEFPPGGYLITARLDVPPGVSIRGAGKTATVFKSSYNGPIFRNTLPHYYSTGASFFENFAILGDTTKTSQKGIDFLRTINCTFRNLYVSHCGSDGIHLRQAITNRLEEVEAVYCGGAGIHFGIGIVSWADTTPNVYPSNNNTVDTCHGGWCDGAGLLLDGYVNGTNVRGGAYENNYLSSGDNVGYNIEVRGTAIVPNVLDGVWVEGPCQAHVYQSSTDISSPLKIIRLNHFGNGASGNVDRCVILDHGFMHLEQCYGHGGAYKTISASKAPFRINKAGADAQMRVVDCYGSTITDENWVEDTAGASTGLTTILKQNNWGVMRQPLILKTDNNVNSGRPFTLQHEVQAYPWFAFNQNSQSVAFPDPTTGTIDVEIGRLDANRLKLFAGDSLYMDGTWNGGHLQFGAIHIWTSAAGVLYIKNGIPGSETDGTVVGTQT